MMRIGETKLIAVASATGRNLRLWVSAIVEPRRPNQNIRDLIRSLDGEACEGGRKRQVSR